MSAREHVRIRAMANGKKEIIRTRRADLFHMVTREVCMIVFSRGCEGGLCTACGADRGCDPSCPYSLLTSLLRPELTKGLFYEPNLRQRKDAL